MTEYYFTKPDPDYKLKGSRDPLGLQVVWKETAQQVIKYLSTVSVNLKDFQVMCLAYFFQTRGKSTITEIDMAFFIRFEQACAYARHKLNIESKRDDSFNGKDRVAKRYGNYTQNDTFELGLGVKYEILSNQRNYGIWGKYNRPFRDMKMFADENFNSIFLEKIELTGVSSKIYKLIQKIFENNSTTINNEELECFQKLFENITDSERDLYRQYILKTKEPHLQNELYDILNENYTDFKWETLFELTNLLKEHKKTSEFLDAITEIENTEKIICPLNRTFRYLQTKPYGWTKNGNSESGISQNEIISKFNIPANYNFKTAVKNKNELQNIFDKEKWEMIRKLVERNNKISDNRNSLPWISIEGDEIKINSSDGWFYDETGYTEGETFDNFYLLTAYWNLFTEIEVLK